MIFFHHYSAAYTTATLRHGARLAALLLFVAWSGVWPRPAVAADDPKAQAKAMIMDGRARFTLLTSRLIRMENAPDKRFENRASLSFVNRRLPVPEYRTRRKDGWLEITTDAVKIRYRRGATSFNSKTLQVRFRNGKQQGIWKPGMTDSENLLGTARTLDGFEGRVRLQDGAHLELEPGVLSRAGWSLIDDSDTLLFDGDPADNRVAQRRIGKRQDWYLFAHGRDYKGALGDFTAVAGKIPLPPRYAFGYWWSRYWVYSDGELRDLIDTMRTYAIPLDVLVIDMDWHETQGLTSKQPEKTPVGGMRGWTGYSWNRSAFPEPERFLAWTEAQRLKVALNLHPADGIAPFENAYDAMREALGEAAPAAGEWLGYRLSDPNWARAYFDSVLRPHEDIGVDFWWLDWQQWPSSRYVSGLNNTFWLNHVFFNDMRLHYPRRRPLLFHRWGGLGNHRYPVGFSGDAVISWKSLAYQPFFTATASNVGYGYWSHDIGGHIDADDKLAGNGELYLRWLQFGALSPILRTHSTKSDVIERRIWRYPEHFTAMRDAIRLRYALFPYLYTYAREAYDSGVAMTRPMYYKYPNTKRAYAVAQQYMLGDKIIVAPVTSAAAEAGLATQEVWLPKGKWHEWHSGSTLKGGRMLRRGVALDEIPIYVKAGAIIPMLAADVTSLQQPIDTLVLTIFPGGNDRLRYYQDDGTSQAYSAGAEAWTEVTTTHTATGLHVDIAPPEGRYDGMQATRRFVLRLQGVAPVKSASLNGDALSADALRYDARTLTQLIDLPEASIEQALGIDIVYRRGAVEKRLLAKPGQFRRLKRLGELVKNLSARDDWAATVPNPLLRLIETPTRIQYQPQRLAQELDSFETGFADVETIIADMPQIDAAEAKTLAQYLSFEAE